MSRIEEALTKASQGERHGISTPVAPIPAPLAPDESSEFSYLSSVNTNLQLALAEVERPVLAFASAVPKEGVSTVVFHLARLMAKDRRVLVVDFNVGGPRLHKLFQTDNIKGLSDILHGRKTLDDCLVETGVPNVHLLPCGPTGHAPLQILGSAPIKRVLAELRARYDWVLIDCPPLRKHPETAILASLCDGVVLVVRALKTRRELVKYSQGLLEKAGARQVGVVLNRVKHWIPDFIYRRL